VEQHSRQLLTDVALAGPCKADIKSLCKDVSPGNDRVLLCLVKRIKQAQQGNVAGEEGSRGQSLPHKPLHTSTHACRSGTGAVARLYCPPFYLPLLLDAVVPSKLQRSTFRVP
jgi:hypothetical protein